MTSAAVPRPERIWFLGSPVDNVDIEGAVQQVDSFIACGGTHSILVTNANKVWLAHRDPRLRAALERADLVVPEWAVAWGAARLGTRLRGMVAGISLLQRLLDEAPKRAWSVFFLGAKPEVVGMLVERARVRWPGLRIAGWHHGYFPATEDAAVADVVRRADPDLLFVGMGSPRQEYWVADRGTSASARVALCVGGSFDVLAGRKPDTPSWIRGTGFEWLFRLLVDPRNLWKRYLITNSWFAWRVLEERLRRSSGRAV